MKKLMIAAAIVCAAALSQAATVSWKSGNMYNPTSTEGGWGSNKLTTGVNGYVFLLSEDQYGALSKSFSQSAIYNGFTANGNSSTLKVGTDTLTVTKTGALSYGALNVSAGTVTAQGDEQWAAIIYTTTDATYGDFYIANVATIEYGGSGTPSVGNLGTAIGGATTAPATTQLGWQSVPEPTSGLLLLLGVAGLALRRRRA